MNTSKFDIAYEREKEKRNYFLNFYLNLCLLYLFVIEIIIFDSSINASALNDYLFF